MSEKRKGKVCESHIDDPNKISRYKNSKKINIEDLTYTPKSSAKGPVIEAGDSFRDKQGTIGEKGKRVWVYPTKPKGKKYDRRTIVSYILLAILVGTPFIHINGNPLMMFNIPERKFIILGSIFWPQDFIIFALIFLSLVLFIVFFTSAWGRVFCGWICPQTIFMEMVFRKIEYWIEGNANKQRQLDSLPWNKEKIIKKGSKHILFYMVSFFIANVFLSYIIGVKELGNIVTSSPTSHLQGFIAILIFSTIFYFVFSWMREQVCTFVCPYGRLQSVLLDRNTIVVAYDYIRGEKREKYKKNGQSEDAGDCIDCKKCVHVCPTGIDIRNGTQLECINCTACIDACDAVMEQVGRPKGLIRYASEDNIAQNKKFKFTPRLMAYTTVLVVLLGVISTLIITRSNIDTRILRAKGQTYIVKEDGHISNLYNMKVINKTFNDMSLTLDVLDYDEKIEIIGGKVLEAKANEVLQATFHLELPKNQLKPGTNKVLFQLKSNGKVLETYESNFSAPINLKE